MTSRRPLLWLAAAALIAGGLAGCGKTGLLEQPAPLFGEKAKAQYNAQKKEEADAKARSNAARKAQQTGPIVDDPDSQQTPNGPYNPPNPDHRSDPLAHGPQGAIPDPATAPDQ
jgi:hypothetical protein